jgi:hypothetical protein
VRIGILAAVTAGLVLAACGGASDTGAAGTTTTAGPTSTSTPAAADPGTATTTAAPVVPGELDFVAPDVRGGEVVGAELAGRELVIWFWAPW